MDSDNKEIIANNEDNQDNQDNEDFILNISKKLELNLDNISTTSIDSNSSNKLILSSISNNILDKLTITEKTNNDFVIDYLNNTIVNFENNHNDKHNDKHNDNYNEKINTNVSFISKELNDIKSYTNHNHNHNHNNNHVNNSNIDNLSSNNSESNSNYINTAQNQLPIEYTKVNKNIRAKKRKNNHNNNDLDEIDYLYNKLQDYIRYMVIDRTNYIIVIVKAMEIIENYFNLHHNNIADLDKKQTVIKALTRIINIDLSLSNLDEKLFLLSMNNIIEIVILCSKIKSKSKKHIKTEITDNEIIKNENKYINDDLLFASSGQIIHSLIDKLTTIIIKKQYNSDKLFVNICTITDILMILVNKNIYLTNIEKKNIIIQTFNKFISEKLQYIIDLDKNKKNDLYLALDSIPFMIDILISLQNSKFKINNKIIYSGNKSFIKKMLCCF